MEKIIHSAGEHFLCEKATNEQMMKWMEKTSIILQAIIAMMQKTMDHIIRSILTCKTLLMTHIATSFS